MMNIEDNIKIQIRSMKTMSFSALNYHYKNYCEAHSKIDLDLENDMEENIPATESVRMELIAYLNWIGRIYFFINSMKEKRMLCSEFDNHFDNILRHKWSVHRSADYPRKESSRVHLQILLNLDTSQRFNYKKEYEPELFLDNGESIRFNLFERHDFYIEKLNDLFKELEKE